MQSIANRTNSFFTLLERTEMLVPLADNTMAMAALAAESAFLRRKLNRTNGVPLHLQIERMLRKLISSPPYSSGALLPDELTLADRLGVSRGTVRNSILNLVHQGLLERRKGVGTKVVQSGLVAWASLTGEMRRKGIEIQSFLLEVSEKRASSKVAAALKIPDGTIVQCLEQVRGWDNRRVLQSVSWFHPRLKLTGAEDFGKPLYELLKQETGITPVHALEEFRAIPANAVLARRLRIKKGDPLLLRVRTTVDANDLPIDYAEIYYQTGVISLTLASRWRPVDQA
jgi:GntR family transcriptional regulator